MSPRELVDRAQRLAAASDLDSNIVVTAGAGTGKTSLLVERLLHLVVERGVDLDRIAAITFTNKAAAELRDRLEEALERTLELASESHAERSMDPSQESEADRVFSRLDPSTRSRAARRSLNAIRALDSASIGTIHGFAGELLRRRHRAADVDIGFEVDDGRQARELFDGLWARFLESRLGPGGDTAPWAPLLRKLSLDCVESIARELVAFSVPQEVLSPDAADVQRGYAKRLAATCLGQLRAIRSRVQGVTGLNRNLPKTIDSLEAVFSGVTRTGQIERSSEELGLPKTTSVGSGASIEGKEELKKRLDELLGLAGRLVEADARIVEDLSRCLDAFVADFRAELLRRGFVSYDALVVLARNLLRDDLDVRREETARFDQILVDEFQDTDPLQYEIVLFLAEDLGVPGVPATNAFSARLVPGKLFIVGDAKQSIYHFRGADVRAYERAVAAILREGGKVLTLTANFRSVPGLVEPINDLFRRLLPASDDGPEGAYDPPFSPLVAQRTSPAGAAHPRVEIWSVGDGALAADARRGLEAHVVAVEIRREVDSKVLRYGEIAILLSSLTEVDTLLRELRRRGIPYVIDGGKGFYRRHEVELLLAFLRVLACPSDSVALVECLRSPALAVPDGELQLWAARSGVSGWSLDARPDPEELPGLARGLQLLRDLRARHLGRRLDRLARAVLDELPLRLSMAASYEGGQRVANLEKVVRRIAELAENGRLTDLEIIDDIESTTGTDLEEGDSPLADETVDAVRVMSIHKAKGLEFPMVILPDLARSQQPPQSGRSTEVATDPDFAGGQPGGSGSLPPALALRADGVVTPAFLYHEREERLQRVAEQKRLLYVALTRARERLVLVVGAQDRRGSSWVDALHAWGYERGSALPGDGTCHGDAVLLRSFTGREEESGPGNADGGDSELLEAARTFSAVAKELAALEGGALLRPSGEVAEVPPGEATAAEHGTRALALATGSAVHLLLEVWDRRETQWLLDHASRAARVVASAAGVDSEKVGERVEAIVRSAEATGKLDQLRRQSVLARELPMLYRDDAGNTWDGTLDLVVGDPSSPAVVDYKTTAGTPPPGELERAYRGQLEAYAEGLRRALGLDAPPPARIEPLGASDA